MCFPFFSAGPLPSRRTARWCAEHSYFFPCRGRSAAFPQDGALARNRPAFFRIRSAAFPQDGALARDRPSFSTSGPRPSRRTARWRATAPLFPHQVRGLPAGRRVGARPPRVRTQHLFN